MEIPYAILASIGQGIGYTLLKKSNTNVPNSISFAFDALFGLLIWISYAIIEGITSDEAIRVFPYAILSAILACSFYLFLFFLNVP